MKTELGVSVAVLAALAAHGKDFDWLANGTPMFVSRGLARESSPIPRFFNHPEVVFIDLTKGKSSPQPDVSGLKKRFRVWKERAKK